MDLTLVRVNSTSTDTLGLLFIRTQFICFTLEDAKRKVKVFGRTRIPSGRYLVTLRRAGGFYRRYSKRFKKEHPILWIRKVKNFRWVYFHPGNTHKDTKGCVLVGRDYTIRPDSSLFLSRSIDAYLELHKRLIEAIEEKKEKVILSILDADFEGSIR